MSVRASFPCCSRYSTSNSASVERLGSDHEYDNVLAYCKRGRGSERDRKGRKERCITRGKIIDCELILQQKTDQSCLPCSSSLARSIVLFTLFYFVTTVLFQIPQMRAQMSESLTYLTSTKGLRTSRTLVKNEATRSSGKFVWRRHDWDEIGGHHKTIIEDEIIKWIIVHLDPPVRAVFVRDHKGRGRKERKEKVRRRLRSVARGHSPRVYYQALSSCHWNLWHAVVV